METRRKRRLIIAARWALYFLILMCAAALQTMPGFLTIGDCKPFFILGVALSVAMFEGEFYGALFGAVCGLLWDYVAGRTVGMLALGIMALCFFASVLVQLYFKISTVNFFLLNLGSGLLILSMDFLFFYLMRGYVAPAQRYLTVILPETLFSAVLAQLTLCLVRFVAERFTVQE